MRHEALMEMSKSELDEYATMLGIDTSGQKTIATKVALIEKERGKTADVDVLGTTVTIPIKRLHDKRVSDLAAKRPMTDADAETLLTLLIGDEQVQTLYDRVTEDDGTVDVDALGLAMARILGSGDLKNF